MPLALVGLVDAENLGADGRFNLIGHAGVNKVFHRALFPVREQRFAVNTFIFFADGKTILGASGETVQFVQ